MSKEHLGDVMPAAVAEDSAGLLISSADMSVPRFRGEWRAPAALKRGADLLREHQFLALNAIAGSGKSRFMAHLFLEMQARMSACCWLTISAPVQNAGDMARLIVASLTRSALTKHSASSAALMCPGLMEPETILAIALNEVASTGRPTILCLDQIENIQLGKPLDLLQRLFDHAPENLSIVASSRAETKLRLAKARADGRLAEFTSDDFCLSYNQTEAMVTELLGEPRPDLPVFRAVWEQTRGWVMGVRLCCQSMRAQRSRSGAVLPGTIGPAGVAYFEEEMLKGVSIEARKALGTLMLPCRLDRRLLLDICDNPDTSSFIAEYEARYLLRRVNQRGSIEYQPAPLLAAFVRERALLTGEATALHHRRACDWFEAAGDLSSAAAHAVEGGDFPRAVDLIERCGMDMIATGQVTNLQHWLPRLPIALLRARPMALLAVAWALSLLYRLDEAEPLILAVEEDIRTGATRATDAQMANIDALKIMHLSMRDHLTQVESQATLWTREHPQEANWARFVIDNSLSFSLAHLGDFANARRVLEAAYLPDYYSRGPYAAIYSRCILGLIDLRQGRIRSAEAHFTWSLKLAENVAGLDSTGAVMAAGLLAGARYERNDIEGAHRLLGRYAWSLHEHLFTDARFYAYRTLARIQDRQRQYRAAAASLERILDAGPAVRLTRVNVDVLAEKCRLALGHNDFRLARAYIETITHHIEALSAGEEHWRPQLAATLEVCRAHMDLLSGRSEQAVERLVPIIKADLRSGWILQGLQRSLLLVSALWRCGRHDLSARVLRRIIRFAAPVGVVRSVLDGGRDVENALNHLVRQNGFAADHEDRRLQRYVRQLQEGFDPGSAARDAKVDKNAEKRDPLTERERELIRFVKAGMSNRQIGSLMHVSENTVKWHLKNIFGKLHVTARSELTTLNT